VDQEVVWPFWLMESPFPLTPVRSLRERILPNEVSRFEPLNRSTAVSQTSRSSWHVLRLAFSTVALRFMGRARVRGIRAPVRPMCLRIFWNRPLSLHDYASSDSIENENENENENEDEDEDEDDDENEDDLKPAIDPSGRRLTLLAASESQWP
jgi:hypothetical protein